MNKFFLRPVFLSFLLIILIVFFARTVNATGWANPSLERCMDINITNAGSETLTNFPAYINLTHDNDMLSDFKDIRFYNASCNNDGTVMDYEIENYTYSDRAHIWVRIPNLPSSETTISIYYKNNTAISSGENPTGVWDDNYMMVQHLQETTLNGNITYDSTQYGNNGTAYNFSAINATGKIDGAIEFDGSDDYVEANSVASGDESTWDGITLSAWVKHKSYSPTAQEILRFDNGMLGQDGNLQTGGFQCSIPMDGWWEYAGGGGELIPNLNQWYHVVGTYDKSNIILYVDGVEIDREDNSSDISNFHKFEISRKASPNRKVNGSIDEVRISNTTRTSDWINQSYLMVAEQSTYAVFGGEEERSLLQCTFIQNTTCPSGTARLIGVRNDTDGFQNAHAQNTSIETYNYSICCNVTDNASIHITSGCPGNATVIKLSNATNAHVEIGTNSNYSVSVCLSSDWKYVSCSYPTGSCPSGSFCVLSMASSEGANTTNAHVGTCSQYDQKVCCKLENHAPIKPILYYPADGNTSVFERRPNFNWSLCTDPDGDTVDYTLNITCGTCSDACKLNVSGISTTNHTVSTALCVDTDYNWTVSACDIYDECNTSTIFDFRINSTMGLELIVNQTSFGSMDNDENNDTTDDSPEPMVARNTGNVLLNVTINASALFNSVVMNTVYYQFKADENETGSYDKSCSQDDTFANMQTSPQTIFCNLSYEDVHDEGEIELNITIPHNEGAGARNSIIKVTASATE